MQALRKRIAAAASARSTVLITGETGTGKGLVARLLHGGAPGSERPFVHVDCGVLSAGLVESELFGHERGAFTGARERRAGCFERAGPGTLFLDEVGELSRELQAKFSRVLHDREFERIGGTRTLRMEARVIAATSGNLSQRIREGRFRSDLYFRLAVIELHVPALRDRIADLPSLVRCGIDQLAARLAVPPPSVLPEFCERLTDHSWPGNVRELFNLLERLLVEGTERLDASVLERFRAASVRAGACGPPARELGSRPEKWQRVTPAVVALECERIASTLVETGGNVARAARRLGLPRSTLRHQIRRHRLAHLIPKD